MLFQTYGFIFGFLPVLVVASQYLRNPNFNRIWRNYFIVVASVIFYALLSPSSLPFLLLSCSMNLFIGNLIHRAKEAETSITGILLGTGITLNVILLVTFKYSGELGWIGIPGGFLPLGASFITFIQIIYLIQMLNGSLRKLSPIEYLQIPTFLGYVTSGPVVNATELVEQYDALENNKRLNAEHLLAGMVLFAIGLFKKLVVADSLAPYATLIFDAAHQGHAISTGDAWLGSIFYMLQLYFDFSGYSDMAIGIGFLVGIRLPLNFNSPFKATTVMDYWRRWHMSLTRFITHYLYLPLAVAASRWLGSKQIESEMPRFALAVVMPTMVAFLIAGVWHGNGWTFFTYGLFWGGALSIFQVWHRYCPVRIPWMLAWALTMLTALVSLVIFRSPSLNATGSILQAAVGASDNGVATELLPSALGLIAFILVGALLVLPNSQQILSRYHISSDEVEEPPSLSKLTWSPTPAGAVFLGTTLVIALLMGGGPTQFLYYKF
ncbi:MBOAT family O-acyltransferase [Phyllobacterium leguminum]|uniref:Probable alginate O-acetylase AlgI n=1 Tax=Phyllobacterium leguminum TaxID=314237 RepID=A0A318SUR7_9HYPH|nr:MBOAT family O-acyltransferase [Phyllobacterium leguminum]PYE85135.1 D-alanyl-lipoteichoic acid acyltransferase DltB (MBOAT superfamily) [Phyllobacterium leguminum]